MHFFSPEHLKLCGHYIILFKSFQLSLIINFLSGYITLQSAIAELIFEVTFENSSWNFNTTHLLPSRKRLWNYFPLNWWEFCYLSSVGQDQKIFFTLGVIQNADLLTYFLTKPLGFDFFFFYFFFYLINVYFVRKQYLLLLYLLCKLWKEEVGWKIDEETCQTGGGGFSVVIQSKIPMLPRGVYQCRLLFLPFQVSSPYHGICILILVPHSCSDEILLPSLLRNLEKTQCHKSFWGFVLHPFFSSHFTKFMVN